ncbi:hypothetical protein J6590_098936 [Homalodisca vitripennis]|nr:hypothetical protein J6590_098936 [Homalodisca vitripennis]
MSGGIPRMASADKDYIRPSAHTDYYSIKTKHYKALTEILSKDYNTTSGAYGGIVQSRTEVDLILTDFDKDKREAIVSLPRKMLFEALYRRALILCLNSVRVSSNTFVSTLNFPRQVAQKILNQLDSDGFLCTPTGKRGALPYSRLLLSVSPLLGRDGSYSLSVACGSELTLTCT